MQKLIRKVITSVVLVFILVTLSFFYVAQVRHVGTTPIEITNNKKTIESMIKDYKSQYESRGNLLDTKNDGIELKAEYVSNDQTTNKTLILVHGYRNDRADMYPYADMALKMGYNVLLPDLRGHGESGGMLVGFGWSDRNDLLQWVNYLIDQRPDVEIGALGISMGASTILSMSRETLPDNVKVLIADSGFTNADSEISYQVKNSVNLPRKPVVPILSFMSRITAGFTYQDADSLKAVQHNKLPLFVIHGEKDDFVPTKMGRQIFNADPDDNKELWIVPNSHHIKALQDYPEEYQKRVGEFLAKYLK